MTQACVESDSNNASLDKRVISLQDKQDINLPKIPISFGALIKNVGTLRPFIHLIMI